MNFPPIPEDSDSIDSASFDFDDFLYGMVMHRLYGPMQGLLLLLELQRLLGLVVELLIVL